MVDTQEKVVIFGEVFSNKLDSGFAQLLTKARAIAPDKHLIGLVPVIANSREIPNYIEEAKYYGADELILFEVDEKDLMNDLVISDALTNILKDITPSAVLMSATPFGRSIAARIQYDLQTSLTADCLDLYFEKELLVQVKPSFGDNILCEIVSPTARPQMATVRPNTFKQMKTKKATQEIRKITTSRPNIANQVSISVKEHQETSGGLADAEVVIALGRGVQDKKLIDDVKKLANHLDGKVGVTRPMTDLDEFTIDDQIGQSGTMIAPKVLLNLGISGAMQYTAGIKNAKTVLSVNTDSEAPIFTESDVKIVADAADVIQGLI